MRIWRHQYKIQVAIACLEGFPSVRLTPVVVPSQVARRRKCGNGALLAATGTAFAFRVRTDTLPEARD